MSGGSEAEQSSGRRSVVTWLACLAFAYPLYWLTAFLLQALPALADAALPGHRLTFIQVTPTAIFAASEGPGLPDPAAQTHLGAWVATGLVALAICFALARHDRGWLGGLVLAMLGQAGAEPISWRITFGRPLQPPQWLIGIGFFALLCLGLRWLVRASGVRRFVPRFGMLLACLSLPLAVIAALGAFRFGPGHRPLWVASGVAASVVASLIAAAPKTRSVASAPDLLTRKTIVVGAVASVGMFVAAAWGGPALSDHFWEALHQRNLTALASLPPIPKDAPYPKVFFQKGVNFTAEFPDTYDSEGARRMLEALPQHGINAIALVPYGWTTKSPPTVRFNPRGSWENDAGLEAMSRVAHALGMKVLLKPAIWRADGLTFPSPVDRAAWFAQYQLFLEHYAQLATRIHADVFCIGGEFSRLTPYEADWRHLIGRVRQLYPGPLTYAANWGEEFESLKFWDALDYIGLQEYYPLPDDLSTDAIVQKVEAVQKKFNKPVILTEVGFPSLVEANRRPWDDSSRALSPDLQAQSTEAVFRAFYNQPWFEGMYWWKIETNGSGGPGDGSHSLWRKPAMQILERWYGRPER